MIIGQQMEKEGNDPIIFEIYSSISFPFQIRIQIIKIIGSVQ